MAQTIFRPQVWQLHTLDDLLADTTPMPPDFVDGFITGLSVILFSGPGGDGKSYEMLDMAMHVARGVPWLGIDTLQTSVLIIDLENRLIRVRERVRRLMKGYGLRKCPPVTIAFGMDYRLDNDNVVAEVEHMAKKCKARLVIFDSLVDFLGETDENSNPEMGKVAERMRHIVEAIDGSLIAIHHTPKNNANTPRGATALRNGIDVNILNAREGNTVTMKQDKNRAGPEKTITARLNWMPGMFNMSPVGIQVGRSTRPPDEDEDAILQVLSDGLWHTSSDIINAAMNVTHHSRSTIHRKMKAMIQDNVLRMRDRGAGKPFLVRHDPFDMAMD